MTDETLSSAIHFELRFLRGFDSVTATDGEIEAQIVSDALDKAMHPDGSAVMELGTRAADPGGAGGFVLDAFQMNSIQTYLRNQSSIRKVLEQRLKTEHGVADVVDGDIWPHVTVLCVCVHPRQVPTPENLKVMQKEIYPDETIEAIADMFDKADTRSGYMMMMDVEWDEEHQRWAQFRDGELFELSAT